MKTQRFFVTAVVAAAFSSVFAQHHGGNSANWDLLEKYSSGALRKFVYSSSVAPRWINESNKFWYVWNDSNGKRFMYVDPGSKKKEHAFDLTSWRTRFLSWVRNR